MAHPAENEAPATLAPNTNGGGWMPSDATSARHTVVRVYRLLTGLRLAETGRIPGELPLGGSRQ